MKNKAATTQLLELLTTYFSLLDLQALCFELGINYEELPDTRGTVTGVSIALIKILREQNMLPKFVELCRQKRPHVDWPDASTVLYLEEDLQTIQNYKAAIQAETQHDNLFDFALGELYIPLKGQEPAQERPKEARPNLPAVKDLQAESSSDQTEGDALDQPRRDEKDPGSPSIPSQPLPLDLQEAVEKHPRLIVLGTAGTGKSTFLRHLAHQKAKDNNNVIPIQVSLSKFVDERKQNSKVGFEEWAVNAATFSNQAQHNILIEEIKAGHILWLLDGFDEAIQKTDDPEGFTNLIARSMEGQQFVLTTRPDDIVIKRLSRFKDATQYEMRDLSQHDIEQFLQKWFKTEPAEADKVLEWLADDSQRLELIKKPLHLVLLAMIRKETSEDFPETRVRLYGKFIAYYVDKRIDKLTDKRVDEFKELGEELTGTKAHDAILHGFYYLGWVLFQQQNGLYIYEKKSLPESKPPTIEEQVITCLQNGRGYSKDTAAKIFSFWKKTGVQETFQQGNYEQEANLLESFHQTFWAYAAACKLYDDWHKDSQHTWQFLSSATRDLPYASRLHHPAWQEPILMLAALMDEEPLNKLIGCLLSKRDKEERYLHQNLRLAAAILGEVEQEKVNPEYKKRIINQLGQLLQNHTWKRGLIEFSAYVAIIIILYQLLPLWAFGSIVLTWIVSAFDDDSPPSDMFYIAGPFLLSLAGILIPISIAIEIVLSWPLILLRWRARRAIKTARIYYEPEYIWEYRLFPGIALFTGCILVVFIFYKYFPLWVLGGISLLWLFDTGNWLFNRYDASGTALRLFRLIGIAISRIHRIISTRLVKLFGLTTFNTGVYLEALAQIGTSAVPQLERLLHVNAQDMRHAIIRALGRTKSPEATNILIQALIYQRAVEPRVVIEALGKTGNTSAIPALVFVWQDSHQGHGIHKAIIQALMKIDKRASLPIIANMVEPYKILDPPEFIRNYTPPSAPLEYLSLEERVWQLFVKLSEKWDRLKKRFLPFFALDNRDKARFRYMYDRSPKAIINGGSRGRESASSSYRWAIEEIAQIRDRDLISTLEPLLEHEMWGVRYAAAIALSHMGEPSAIPHLISAIEHVVYDDQEEIKNGLISISRSDISPLIDYFLRSESDNKGMVINVLGLSGNPAAIPILKQILAAEQHYHDGYRGAAATALGKIGGPDAISALKQALQDSNSDVRSSATQALGEVGVTAIPILIEALDNSDWGVREEAAESLRKIGSTGVKIVLNKLEAVIQNDSHDRVRRAAKLAYRELSGKTSILIHKLEKNNQIREELTKSIESKDEFSKLFEALSIHAKAELVREDDVELINTLGKIGDETAIPILTQALTFEGSSQAIWEAVREAYTKTIAPGITDFDYHRVKQVVGDAPQIRRAAAVAMGTIGGKGVVAPLLQALRDDNEWVREAAAVSLGKIGDEQAIPHLIKALENNYSEVRQAIEESLKQLRLCVSSNSTRHLLKLLKSDNRTVCESAEEILLDIGSSAVKPLCDAYRNSNDAKIQYQIVEILGKMGDRDATPLLVEALENNDTRVSREAVQVLTKIGSVDVEDFNGLLDVFNDKGKSYLHPETTVALGQLARSISDAGSSSDKNDPQEALESARKTLWQRRFAHYKEQVFTAYEQIITQLTIAQVRKLPQNNSSHSSTKIGFLSRLQNHKWTLLLAAAILIVFIQIFSSLFTEILLPYLPSGIWLIILLVVIFLAIILLTGIQRHFNESKQKNGSH